jgi:hypothetical protein
VASPPGPGTARPGKTWLRRFHHQQQQPPVSVITAAVSGPPVYPLGHPIQAKQSRHCKAGVLATAGVSSPRLGLRYGCGTARLRPSSPGCRHRVAGSLASVVSTVRLGHRSAYGLGRFRPGHRLGAAVTSPHAPASTARAVHRSGSGTARSAHLSPPRSVVAGSPAATASSLRLARRSGSGMRLWGWAVSSCRSPSVAGSLPGLAPSSPSSPGPGRRSTRSAIPFRRNAGLPVAARSPPATAPSVRPAHRYMCGMDRSRPASRCRPVAVPVTGPGRSRLSLPARGHLSIPWVIRSRRSVCPSGVARPPAATAPSISRGQRSGSGMDLSRPVSHFRRVAGRRAGLAPSRSSPLAKVRPSTRWAIRFRRSASR